MSRFSLPPDNLWTHRRSEVDVLLPREALLLAYPDLGYLAKNCDQLESIAFLEVTNAPMQFPRYDFLKSPIILINSISLSFQAPYKSHRVPIGRSFFRFLAIGTFDNLTTLDLTMTR